MRSTSPIWFRVSFCLLVVNFAIVKTNLVSDAVGLLKPYFPPKSNTENLNDEPDPTMTIIILSRPLFLREL